MTKKAKCIVIMPFGKKIGPEGTEVDFDLAYHEVIQEAAENVGLEVLRLDEIQAAGDIHKDMFYEIATAEVAIVDITMSNPNVFYELGARHVLKSAVTVIVRQRETSVPFNIQGQRIINYPGENGSFRESREAIQAFIVNGLTNEKGDSPWEQTLERVQAAKDANSETRRIGERRSFTYRLREHPRTTIEVRTGEILRWRGADVWVSSENVNMQMARFYDRSLSAVIRFNGAEKDENGNIVRDTIADALYEAQGDRKSVELGSVLVTTSGNLERTNGVRRVFHVASVFGVPGQGYRATPSIVDRCVINCLERMSSPSLAKIGLRTITFPILGAGAGEGDTLAIAKTMVDTTVSFLQVNPESPIDAVYLTAWSGRDLKAYTEALDNCEQVEGYDTSAQR